MADLTGIMAATDPVVIKAAAETIRPIADWFAVLGLGAIAGMLGQGARVIVGLKKLNDAASASGGTKSVADMIEPSRLLVSLMIGAIAGALAATIQIGKLDGIGFAVIMGLAAAGYLGADFIEGFMGRFTPKTDPAQPAPATDGAAG